jgi:VWFA-related protein
MSTSRRAISAAFSLIALAGFAVLQGAAEGRGQQPTAGQQQPSGQQQPAPASTAPPAQQGDQQQPPTTIRRGINYVSVDVIVTDKDGKPVMDLTQDDFSVAEDGKPQKVDTFQIIKLDALESMENGPPRPIRDELDEEREAARPDVRLFLILLDDYHVTRGNDLSVKKPLIEFVQNQLAPADMVALMYPLTPITDLRFSRNREDTIAAINQFEGRKFDYRPRNMFEEKYANYPAQTVERIRNQITMDALKGAAMKMGALREGRKSVIFISEGFTGILPAQMSDPVASMPGYNNPYSRGGANAPVATAREQMISDSDMIFDMQQVFAAMARMNTSIYSVDPRGLAVFEYGIEKGVTITQDATSLRQTQDTLQVMAANTDGRAIINRNDLATGMKQIIRDSSAYYLLGYSSAQAPTDGKFHTIKVNIKRKGVEVRARKGYWAYTVDDVARANAPRKEDTVPSAVSTALNDLATPTRDRSAHFWIGTARGENGKSHVTFSWEPAPDVPGQRSEDPPARIALTVIAPDGRQVYRGRVPEDLATPGAPVKGGSVSFDVPPGQLQLKMTVEGLRGQVIDTVGRDITVPDFTSVTMSFGTPRVYRVRTIPELNAIKAKPDAVPTTEREFSRSDRLYIRADAYAPGGIMPPVTARLLNRMGQAMSDLKVQQAPGRPAEIEMALSSLAAGEYVVELNARSEGGSSAQELIAFRVGR